MARMMVLIVLSLIRSTHEVPTSYLYHSDPAPLRPAKGYLGKIPGVDSPQGWSATLAWPQPCPTHGNSA